MYELCISSTQLVISIGHVWSVDADKKMSQGDYKHEYTRQHIDISVFVAVLTVCIMVYSIEN